MTMDGQEQEFPNCQEDAQVSSSPQPGGDCIGFSNHGLEGANSSSLIKDGGHREYRWSKAARDLARANLTTSGPQLSCLITRLVEESGYPRWACWKFVRRMGIRSSRPQRRWTQAERKRLEKLIDLQTVSEIARTLNRSQSSVWHMLYRMGASAAMGRDSFTKNSLAVALHVSPVQIETWIKRGWLIAREVQTGSIKRVIIAAEDFCHFCRAHTKDVVGNRLSKERLDFVYHFAFPRSHAELLPVRESKKERDAYVAQVREDRRGDESAGFGPARADDEDEALDHIA